jgi:hypothetical protein
MGFFDTYSPPDERAWWERVLDEYPDLRSATDEQVRNVFESRAIDKEIWQERAYLPYKAGDWDAVEQLSGYSALSEKKQQSVRRKVLQRPGLVMQRHGLNGRPLLAQLRPFRWNELGLDVGAVYGVQDEGVFSNANRHRHKPLDYHVHTETGHIFPDSEPDPRKSRPSSSFDLDKHILTQHLGVPPPIGLKHEFHLPWKPHQEASHDGDVGEVGLRLHGHNHFAKYLYPPGEGAKALDVHPRAWPLLKAGGSVVYFVMEGVLKNDAILSTGAAAVNCGSVTLWKDSGLERFAKKYLASFGTVVVVPDSDWLFNRQVSHQAWELHDQLVGWLRDVIIAAPPQKECRSCVHAQRSTLLGVLPPAEHKLGVDDFLGGGHSLQQLEVAHRDSPDALDSLCRELEDKRLYANRRQRDMGVLTTLIQRADDNGIALTTYRQLGNVINRGADQAGDSLHFWQSMGHLNFEPSSGPGIPTVVRLAPELVQRKTTMTLGQYLERRPA